MDIGGVTSKIVDELKGLGQETGKQLGQAGKEIVKGTVGELLGGGQRGQVEQGSGEGVPQQVPVMNEMEELKQRKAVKRERGLKRVRAEMANYIKWKKQLEEELSIEEDKEVRVRVAKKEKKRNFWQRFLGKTRSQYGGTGEMVKTKH